MISQILKDTIFKHVPALKQIRSGWYTCNCPVCSYMGHSPDRKGRFGFKESPDGSFGINCFNCSFKARWNKGDLLGKQLIWFLENINISEEYIRELKFAAFREREEVDHIFAPSLEEASSKWAYNPLPEGSKTLIELANEDCQDVDFLDVAQYAISRNMPNLENLYWCPSKEMKKRLIIPFEYRGFNVGYTARHNDVNRSLYTPKYLSDVPENYIYNLDAQHYDRKFTILVEGPIDAMMVSGIACLGNKLNKMQIDVINSLKKTIILCPDRDITGNPLIDVAIEQGWYVSFPKWESNIKDVAEASLKYGRVLTTKSILESVVSNPLKIYVSRKFDTFGN